MSAAYAVSTAFLSVLCASEAFLAWTQLSGCKSASKLFIFRMLVIVSLAGLVWVIGKRGETAIPWQLSIFLFDIFLIGTAITGFFIVLQLALAWRAVAMLKGTKYNESSIKTAMAIFGSVVSVAILAVDIAIAATDQYSLTFWRWLIVLSCVATIGSLIIVILVRLLRTYSRINDRLTQSQMISIQNISRRSDHSVASSLDVKTSESKGACTSRAPAKRSQLMVREPLAQETPAVSYVERNDDSSTVGSRDRDQSGQNGAVNPLQSAIFLSAGALAGERGKQASTQSPGQARSADAASGRKEKRAATDLKPDSAELSSANENVSRSSGVEAKQIRPINQIRPIGNRPKSEKMRHKIRMVLILFSVLYFASIYASVFRMIHASNSTETYSEDHKKPNSVQDEIGPYFMLALQYGFLYYGWRKSELVTRILCFLCNMSSKSGVQG